jgi:hypothetical protein
MRSSLVIRSGVVVSTVHITPNTNLIIKFAKLLTYINKL